MTGDLICDTNSESEIHFGCGETRSCGSVDPAHNYMAYSDGHCMDTFTEEQARRTLLQIELGALAGLRYCCWH